MITGFNTDVKHNGKVYHVQTEDKGRNNPKIESLVYVGGEILDNYRTTYQAQEAALSEEGITLLLEQQHQKVMRTIKIGKYDTNETFSDGVLSKHELDDLILNYLQDQENEDCLKLVPNGIAPLLRNHQSTLTVETKRAVSKEAIEGSLIRVKLSAPQTKPQLLTQGQTDSHCIFTAEVALPDQELKDGFIVVQALSEWGSAEQKFPLRR